GLRRALRSRTSTVFFDETGGGSGAGGGGTTNLTETSFSLRLSSGRVDIHISAVSPAACRRIETIAPVPILLLGALERLRTSSNNATIGESLPLLSNRKKTGSLARAVHPRER